MVYVISCFMIDRLVSVRQLEEAIQSLEREIAPVAAKLAELNGRKAKLEIALETVREFSAEAAATIPAQQEQVVTPEPGLFNASE